MELGVNKIYKLFKRAKQYMDQYNDRVIRIRAGLNQLPSIHYCFGLPVLISKTNVTTTANITQLLLSGLRVKGIFKIWFFVGVPSEHTYNAESEENLRLLFFWCVRSSILVLEWCLRTTCISTHSHALCEALRRAEEFH